MSIILSLFFYSAAPDEVKREPDQLCSELPAAAELLDVQHIAATRKDGSQLWGAQASYTLSTGDSGEAFYYLDSDGTGEALLTIGGVIVAHTAVNLDAEGQPVSTWWLTEDVDELSPEQIAELLQIELPGIVADQIPQEFKCSDWGKKVMKAGRYLWAATVGASSAVCCLGTATAACPVCLGAAAVVGMAGDNTLSNHCD